MEAMSFDPRILSRVMSPEAYAVIFWDTSVVGSPSSDEYLLPGSEPADQILAWAAAHAEGRDYEIHVLCAPDTSVRIYGHDPTANPNGDESAFVVFLSPENDQAKDDVNA